MNSVIRSAILLAILVVHPVFPVYKMVAPDTLASWISGKGIFGFILIDVRDTSELQSGGVIASERRKPYHLSLNSNDLKKNVALLPKGVPIILYCRSGSRSGVAATYLDGQGFSTVYSMTGGVNNYSGTFKPYAEVKPLSLLPALSYEPASFVMHPRQRMHNSVRGSSSVGGGIVQTTLQGRVVERGASLVPMVVLTREFEKRGVLRVERLSR